MIDKYRHENVTKSCSLETDIQWTVVIFQKNKYVTSDKEIYWYAQFTYTFSLNSLNVSRIDFNIEPNNT